jgi:O-succinylbenzoic acid--CoA ligase
LALSPLHVAGIQVCVRAELAGRAGVPDPLVVASTSGRLDPAGFAQALQTALDPAHGDEHPVFVSLVPTQLSRLFVASGAGSGSGSGAARQALNLLSRCEAILLGGASSSLELMRRAADAGLRAVRTYGATETSGGCVYVDAGGADVSGADAGVGGEGGLPLPGVRVAVRDGRIAIAGPMLAQGYVLPDGTLDTAATNAAFICDDDGVRWFLTSDLGELAPDGRLTVQGRADDVIITGGVNVHPGPIEECLTALLGAGVVVIGIADQEWGQRVVAVVETGEASSAGMGRAGMDDGGRATPRPMEGADLQRVRAEVSTRLGAASSPRCVYYVNALPRTSLGKVDRRALVAALGRATGSAISDATGSAIGDVNSNAIGKEK